MKFLRPLPVFLCLLSLAAALPAALRAQAAGYTDWNAGRDLALNEKPDGGAQESANPNATVPQWSYGYRTGIANTSLTLYTAAEHLNVTSGIYAGYEGYGDTAQQYGAGVHVGTEPYTFSGLETLAADEIFTSVDDHSTDGNNVIRWTCPANGVYSYRVSWHDLDSRGGDGAAGYVVINGVQRFKGTWPNGSGQGAATFGTVTLNAGDKFDVLLNANSTDSSYDTAGTRIVIAPGSTLPGVSVSVPATANIYGAGHATPPGGGGLPPVTAFPAKAGQVLTFSSVTGQIRINDNNDNGGSGPNGPDGGTYLAPTDITATGGISETSAPTTGCLVGVFLTDAEPTDPAPAPLLFSSASPGTNFATLSPAIGQTFFVGDGKTGTGNGSLQKFVVPANATRLYLGIADGYNGTNVAGVPGGDGGTFGDNDGQFVATLTIVGGTNPPIPSNWDAGRDFANNENNNAANRANDPNGLVPQWSYGYRDAIESGSLTLFAPADHIDDFGQVTTEHGFVAQGAGISVNVTAAPIFLSGGRGPIPAGNMAVDAFMPAIRSVVRWTAPAAGTFTYKAFWRDIDPNGGNGAGGYVVVNGTQVFGQTWENGSGNGADTTATVVLRLGDTIDFVLDDKGDGGYDETLFNATVVPSTAGGNLAVPGTANPYLAGQPADVTASGGHDSAPAQSPVLVPGLTLDPNKPLNFSVAGSVSNDPNTPATSGPDGGPYNGATFYNHASENGLAGIRAPINSLVGVFLDNATPAAGTASGILTDYSDPAASDGGVALTGTRPVLGRPFFIGDGLDANGKPQQFYPPTGATRLFLGTLDTADFYNNTGSFHVGVSTGSLVASNLAVGQSVSTPSVPDGGAFALIGDQITYKFTVKNFSTAAIANVVVTDILPPYLTFVSASDGGTLQGGIVTWKLGTLAPTGTGSKTLTLVVKSSAADQPGAKGAFINTNVLNNGYFVKGDEYPKLPGRDLNNVTVLKAPIDVAIASNGANVTPGGTLTYTVDLKNITAGKVKKPTFTFALPAGVKFLEAYYADDNGNMIPLTTVDGGLTFTSAAGSFELNGGQTAIFQLANLKGNAGAHLVLTVQVPYDVLPDAAINIGSAQLTTKTSDENGQNQYGVTVPDTKLSGVEPSAVPALTLLKFVPDAVSISQAVALESVTEPGVALAIEALFPDANLNKSLDKIQKVINPNIVDGTDANGFYEQQVLGAGLPNSPADDFITYVLVYTNVGGAKVKKATLQDRVPAGTQYVAGSATVNGVAADTSKFSLSGDGTLLFNLGNIAGDKPGKPSFGVVTYQVRVLPPDQGGVAVDGFIVSTGGALNTPSLLQTTFAFPGEYRTRVVAPANLYFEPKSLNPVPKIGSTVAYEAYYKNTGSVTVDDARIVATLPPGATNVQTVFVTGDSGTVTTAANGQVSITLPALKKKAEGRVRVTATLTAASFNRNKSLVPGRLELFSAALGAAGARAENPRGPQPRGLHPRGDGVTTPLVADYLIAPYSSPGVGKLFVTVTQPLAVQEGKTYDCLIAIANPTDVICDGVGAYLSLPRGVNFVSSDQDSAVVETDANGYRSVYLPPAKKNGFVFNVPAHGAIFKRVKLLATGGLGGTALQSLGARSTVANFNTLENGTAGTATLAPVYSGETEIYCIPAGKSFDSVRAQIVSAALTAKGLKVPEIEGLPNFKAQVATLTPDALSIATGGADGVGLVNNTVIIPLLNNQALVAGAAKGLLVDQSLVNSGGRIISEDGTGLVAAGAGNLIKVSNLVAAGAGNVVGPDGRPVSQVLSELVAAGAGNLVAAGAGNLIAAGAGNLISQDGSGLVAAGAGNLIKPGFLINNANGAVSPTLASSLQAAGGQALAGGQSNLIAAGAGNLVAAGAGNLVAAGAGNLVAAGAGNLIAAGAGNLINRAGELQTSTAGSSAIQFSGSGVISVNNGGLITDHGSGLISQDGSGLISQDGSGLFGRNN